MLFEVHMSAPTDTRSYEMLVTIKLHGVTQQNVINFIPSSIENGQLICGLLSKKVGDGHTDIKLIDGI